MTIHFMNSLYKFTKAKILEAKTSEKPNDNDFNQNKPTEINQRISPKPSKPVYIKS